MGTLEGCANPVSVSNGVAHSNGAAIRKDDNRVAVVLGAQWGDEGKGKLVDLLASEVDIVCRCQVLQMTFFKYNLKGNECFYILCNLFREVTMRDTLWLLENKRMTFTCYLQESLIRPVNQLSVIYALLLLCNLCQLAHVS
jgi:hypothetical protein